MAPARSTAPLQLGLGAAHRREGGRSSAGAAAVSAEWRALAERMGQGADASLPPARGTGMGVMEAEGVGKGVAAGEGVGVPEGSAPELAEPDGVDRALGVPLGVPMVVGVPLPEGVLDKSATALGEPLGVGVLLPEGVPEGVAVAQGVEVGDRVEAPPEEPEDVPVAAGVGEVEPLGVAVGVLERVLVPVSDPPGELVAVGLGLGSATPWMYTEVPKAVPALATLSHIKVGKVAKVVPQYTRFSERSPKLTPLLTGAGG